MCDGIPSVAMTGMQFSCSSPQRLYAVTSSNQVSKGPGVFTDPHSIISLNTTSGGHTLRCVLPPVTCYPPPASTDVIVFVNTTTLLHFSGTVSPVMSLLSVNPATGAVAISGSTNKCALMTVRAYSTRATKKFRGAAVAAAVPQGDGEHVVVIVGRHLYSVSVTGNITAIGPMTQPVTGAPYSTAVSAALTAPCAALNIPTSASVSADAEDRDWEYDSDSTSIVDGDGSGVVSGSDSEFTAESIASGSTDSTTAVSVGDDDTGIDANDSEGDGNAMPQASSDSPTSSSPVNVGKVIGGIIGSAIAVIAVGVVVITLSRRRRQLGSEVRSVKSASHVSKSLGTAAVRDPSLGRSTIDVHVDLDSQQGSAGAQSVHTGATTGVVKSKSKRQPLLLVDGTYTVTRSPRSTPRSDRAGIVAGSKAVGPVDGSEQLHGSNMDTSNASAGLAPLSVEEKSAVARRKRHLHRHKHVSPMRSPKGASGHEDRPDSNGNGDGI